MAYNLDDGDVLIDKDGRYHMITDVGDAAFDIYGLYSGSYSSVEIDHPTTLRLYSTGAKVLENYGTSGWCLWQK